jgi:hypothetical protein
MSTLTFFKAFNSLTVFEVVRLPVQLHLAILTAVKYHWVNVQIFYLLVNVCSGSTQRVYDGFGRI